MIYDGSGDLPFIGDLAINNDKIVSIGSLGQATSKLDIDATNLAIAPGFINMLSWAVESMIEDGRSCSDIKQGVTLEVFGEGWSWGPLNNPMKQEMIERQADIKYEITWTTLAEYLDFLETKGISPNIASFVGATTVRIHTIGYEDRKPTPEEMAKMRDLVDVAMCEGALGVASALIYPPAFYADTNELIELCKVAAKYDGLYISHLRSEGAQLLEAIDEFLTIAKEANIRAEIYHFKATGNNKYKLELAIKKIDDARKSGLQITTDCYTYTAGATGLNSVIPPWAHEGGHKELIKRLKTPEIRKQIIEEALTTTEEWENLYLESGPEKILLVSFKSEKLKPLTGKTLAQVAKERGKPPLEVAMDLIIEDDSRIGTVYFMMSEENVRKKIKLPFMVFGSDGGSLAPEGVFLKSNPHPRSYGNVARLLGRYCRDEKLIPLEDAIRKLTSLPANTLKIKNRGALKEGYFADIVVFDPLTIKDNATYEKPHQYASGVIHVFVNGVQVLKDGEHTNATPGRVVRGPGWKESSN
ncbi:MAG: amidohydrolase family protein [Candidatus Heimdallarchaeota archaeon]|nr:MAG: amidohydrolase family protein [Candidatus Heimdallarchaeota archaeon]